MIKINNKNVTKMLIDGKEVEKVVANGNTVWPVNSGPTAPEWFPEDLQASDCKIITATTAYNVIAGDIGSALVFIVPALGYATIYQNGNQLGTYYMSIGIYDTRKERLWIISTDSNNVGKAKCFYYDNITSVQLPAISSTNQSRYGLHRLIYYAISQYAPSNNFKIELINSYCNNTATGSNGVDVRCSLNNNSQPYHIGLFDGYVSGIPYYSKCSLFALSNFTSNANYSKYATSSSLANYTQLNYTNNIVNHLYGYSDGIAEYIKGNKYRSSDMYGSGTSISQIVTLSDLEAYPYYNNIIITRVYQYQYGTTAMIKVTWDVD